MIKLYYWIWVDGIVNSKEYKNNDSSWKLSVYMLLTVCNALNLWVILLWLKYFKLISIDITVNIFSMDKMNSATGFIIYFASPFILINYFLIFFNSRYKKLILKYPHKNGRIAMTYSAISIIAGFVSMVLYVLLK